MLFNSTQEDIRGTEIVNENTCRKIFLVNTVVVAFSSILFLSLGPQLESHRIAELNPFVRLT